MITKNCYIPITLLLTLIGSHVSFAQRGLFVGNIQFPNSIHLVPNIRVYYAGHKVNCQKDDNAKKLTFTIPEHKERAFFYLLISPDIEFCSHENTVPFLKLKRNILYKFYALQRVPREATQKKKIELAATIEYTWVIHELNLDLADGRIPDDTIIVLYSPQYIQSIEGGNAVEFPKISIKHDILKLTGSEELLHEFSNRWFLSALNIDTIHDSIKAESIIKPYAKTIIAMAT